MSKLPGEGHISQRSNGLWQGCVQHNCVRKWVYGKTEREVRIKLADLLKSVAVHNRIPTPGRHTLADLITLWLDTSKSVLKPRTLQGYRYLADKHVNPQIGRVQLSRLQPVHIQELYCCMADKGFVRATAQVHAILHRAFVQGVLWGWMADNPADRVVKPVYRPERKDLWTRKELFVFLESVRDHWSWPAWVVLIGTGCRIGELLGLRWSDVDLDAKVIRIQRNVQRIGKEWVVSSPKTAAGERVITLPQEAVTALRRQRAIQAELRLQAGPEWSSTDLVFTSGTGKPLFPSVLQHTIKRVCQRAGIRPVSPHQLRHLHASLLLAQGLPIPAVSQRLGHSNPTITLSIYAHTIAGQDRQAADTIQGVLEARR